MMDREIEEKLKLTRDMRVNHNGMDPEWLIPGQEPVPFIPGPITSNMQMEPVIDIDIPAPMMYGDTDEEPILISTHEEYRKFMMERRGMPARRTRSRDLNNLDDMIDNCIKGKNYTTEEWRRLHIMRFPFNAIINETGKEIKANIPVVPPTSKVHVAYTEADGRGKAFCYTNGVLGIRQMWSYGEQNLLSAVRQWLIDNGYKNESDSYDCELNGRKFLGTLNVNIRDQYIVSETIFTFDYDDEIFRNLPIEHYSRTYQPGRIAGEPGITGLRNEIPGIDVNAWLTEILRRIGYKK